MNKDIVHIINKLAIVLDGIWHKKPDFFMITYYIFILFLSQIYDNVFDCAEKTTCILIHIVFP